MTAFFMWINQIESGKITTKDYFGGLLYGQ